MNLQPDIIACPNCKARNYSNQAVCFNCGAALPGGGTGPQYQQGQQPQPYPPPYPYPQKKGSGVGVAGGIGIGVIVGVLLVVLLCIGGVLFVLFSFGRAVTEIATITSNNYDAKTFDVGQTGESAGWRVTVHSVRREKQGVIPPKEGHEYVVVDATFENTSDKASTMASLINTKVRDGGGQDYSISIGGTDKDGPDGTAGAGEKKRGELAFEVPTGAKGLMFVYDPVFGGGELRFRIGD